MSVFTSWPPDATTEQLDQLTRVATTYALSHSILYLPPISPEKPPPPAPESAVLAPISLIPTPIPRHLFSKALTLQHAYNTLYARIALDTSFLDQVMGPGGVADVDGFTSALWTTWKTLRNEGVPPVRRALLKRCPPFRYVLTDGINFLASLSTSASFALTTCYTNQPPMSRSHSNKSNSIRSRRPLARSASESPECIGRSHCWRFRIVIRITPFI
jgi:Eukaryotic glutathione synthase, ATP binding domain